MARPPLTRLLRGSLALPGALWDAVRPRRDARPMAAAPAPAPATQPPLLLRLRALFTGPTEDEAGPVRATWSEVRLYGGPPYRGPLDADVGHDLVRAIDVAPLDAVAQDFAAAKGRLSRQLRSLGGTAQEVALGVADRLEADLAELAAGLDELSLPRRSRRKRRRLVERLERLLAVAQAVDVDPTRGRRRDLKRVTQAAKRLGKLAARAGAPRRPGRALARR